MSRGTGSSIARPAESEYAPYYRTYIAKVPEGDLVDVLAAQAEQTVALLNGLDDARGEFRYAPDKWTIKEVLGHVTDAERVFCYRALRFARGDATPLPGFEQNDWVPESGAASRRLADLVDEFRAVRQATIAFARSLTPETAARQGTANGVLVSVRALLYIAAGHERHHVGMLKERYGV